MMSRPDTPLLDLCRHRKACMEKLFRLNAKLELQRLRLQNICDALATGPPSTVRPDVLLNEERRAQVLATASVAPTVDAAFAFVKIRGFDFCSGLGCPHEREEDAIPFPRHGYRCVFARYHHYQFCYSCFESKRLPGDVEEWVVSQKKDYIERKQAKPYMIGVVLVA